MRFWQSVRFRIVFGFFLIIAPLVIFLIYNNLYATKIVREQITVHYSNLMNVQVQSNDEILKSTSDFLVQLGTVNDNDVLSLKTLPIDDSDYTLAKVRLNNRFLLDTNYYKMVDTFFVYLRKDGNPLFATQNGSKSPELDALLREYSVKTIERAVAMGDDWEITSIPGDSLYLIKMVDIDLGMYDGAMVQIDTLNKALTTFDVGPDGSVFMMNDQGTLMTSGPVPATQDEEFRKAILHMENRSGTIKWKGKKYLILTQSSKYANMRYVIVTTESYILKNLPFFQKMLYYWIPLLSVAVVTIYLLFLQRFMFRPLVRLIRGMRRIGHGRFDVRLPAKTVGSEFSIMATTFNQMAQQIENLKIDVYEEQLRVQRAEYKHLQVQINPHFYTNTLNIIYNLAALKDYKTVQKLSLHLADYFRFLMHSNRTVIRLENELKHIEHYMEIQKLRYVDKLAYEIEVSPRHLNCEIAPLMLQPFVENAILHGFSKREQDGTPFRIRISSANDPDEPDRIVRITVRDNGPGFPSEMLKDLASGTYLEGSGEQHLGIWNILHRFRMLYGDEGGIGFFNGSGEEGGAIVEVRLPVKHLPAFETKETRSLSNADREDEDDAYYAGSG
ncbi:sensor histidine kinase [Cohnella sp. AR92]|uniref:cache domain-containing sensor histidine kinase n=1 Tax=Cohnella sp. AR92 TaxID=648716 RepID=UPI00131599A4|nr:sensor histidine kinase [Cohnella sp. AR92]